MPANIEKRPQHLVIPANNHDWLAGDLRRNKLPGLSKLIGPRHALPSLAKNPPPLQFRNALVEIPRRRNRMRVSQRRLVIVDG